MVKPISDKMRKELIGIGLLFMLFFLLVSLFSFHHTDLSNGFKIKNQFGLLGAYLSGVLIWMFGMGAFWTPVLLLLVIIRLSKNREPIMILMTITGGLVLIVTTGGLLSIDQEYFLWSDVQFSAGGIIGIYLKATLFKYTNILGGVLIMSLLWMIGLMLFTGLSMGSLLSLSWKVPELFWTGIKKHGQAEPKPLVKTEIIQKKEENKEKINISSPSNNFQIAKLDLLTQQAQKDSRTDAEHLKNQSTLLENKLSDFGVKGVVKTVTPGPVLTTFEYEPAAGVKINKILNLSDDLALALSALSIRIVAPIPGKSVVGIEIPNKNRAIVTMREILESPQFQNNKSKLTISLGKDIAGNPVVAALDKMPHLLIAGATGAGKSVGLNSMICSLLYKSGPDDVKMIMVDPKRIELSNYNGIPHLITPVVTDLEKATNALFWAVKEMEERYELLAAMKVKNIDSYNRKIAKAENKIVKLPYIVIIIDELADLMMEASKNVEYALTRLAQMARAAGIHLILATQRPSVNVLTGVIKANFSTRLSYQVSSKVDSRTIIDANGAELLLGNGDLLFQPPGTATLQRIQGAYISEDELDKIIEFLKQQKMPDYDERVIETPVPQKSRRAPKPNTDLNSDNNDAAYDTAVAFVTKTQQASISMIQRHLRIGYKKAAAIIAKMEEQGVVGPNCGAQPREVLAHNLEE